MSRKIARLLMCWLFVALQTMTPFIHAHAGAVQPSHGGLLHLHQDVHIDAICDVLAAHEHGAEVEVVHGMSVRLSAPGVTSDAQPVGANLPPVMTDAAKPPGAGLPAPPRFLLLPDHTLPHALAPPSA